MKRIIIVLIAAIAASCSDKADKFSNLTGSVDINIKADAGMDEADGGATYARGSAPSYIAGVRVTAKNIEYSGVPDKTTEFTFGADNEAIKMTGLTIGRNRFTATGVCNNPQVNTTINAFEVPKQTGDVDDVAGKYAARVETLHPIYAQYDSENAVEAVVKPSGSDVVNLNMKTQNHRFLVIIDNESDKYKLSFKVSQGSKNSYPGSWGLNSRYIRLFNNENAKGTITYKVHMEFTTKSSGVKVAEYDRTVIVNAGQNVTRLYRYNNNTLEEGEATINITWTPLENIIGGEDL